MKANVPEKIHVQPNAHDRWFEGKIPNGLPDGLFIEYTSTDAFIEKTEEYIYKRLNEGHIECGDIEKFIEDFKNYIKGE